MPHRPENPLLSVIIPVHNEQEAIDAMAARLLPALEQCGCRWEVLLVDDGSTDGTRDRWRMHMAGDPRLGLVGLTRNFGKESALLAGYAQARGDAVVPMDADLQDPPEIIPTFLARWREGFDVVYGLRMTRDDPLWKRLTARWYYRILNRIAQVEIPENAGDFRLLDRAAVDDMLKLREHDRYTKGLSAWIGRRQCPVPYHRPARQVGTTQQPLSKLVDLAIEGITGFTAAPLRLLFYFGSAVSVLASGYGILWLGLHVLGKTPSIPGYPSLLCFILLFGGLNLAALGLIGEYLARIYREVKSRPAYLIEVLHLPSAGPADGRGTGDRQATPAP